MSNRVLKMKSHVYGCEQWLYEVHCRIHFLHRVCTDVHVELLIGTLSEFTILAIQLKGREGKERRGWAVRMQAEGIGMSLVIG